MKNNGITIAKGIVMLLVVINHSCAPDVIPNWTHLFNMPLFFILSGYCFKEKYLDDVRTYTKRRITGLYVPYVKWCLLFLLLHNVFCMMHLYGPEYGIQGITAYPYSLTEMARRAGGIMAFLIANEELLGGYWFLHELFWGSFLFFFLMRATRNVYAVMGITLCATLMMSYFDVRLSYFIASRTAFSAFFIALGCAYRKSNIEVHKRWAFILPAMATTAITSTFFTTTMPECTTMQVFPYALLGLLGTLMLLGLGEKIATLTGSIRNFLIYTGEHTLEILTWHMLCFKLVTFIFILCFSLPIARLESYPVIGAYAKEGWFILYVIVGAGIPLMGCYLLEKFKARTKSIC